MTGNEYRAECQRAATLLEAETQAVALPRWIGWALCLASTPGALLYALIIR